MLDGTIRSAVGESLFWGVAVVWVLYGWHRFGLIPRTEYLRNPKGWPVIGPTSVFSEKKWTDRGRRVFARAIRFAAISAVGGSLLFLLLDAVF